MKPAAFRACSAVLIAFVALLAAGPSFGIDDATIAAAKKEGEVVWYTTQIISQLARPIGAAFEAKYGIKVLATRGDSRQLAVKIYAESKSGRVQVDMLDGSGAIVPLKRDGLLMRWLPDAAKVYPHKYKDADGYWITHNLFINTPGFNTSLVPEGTEPRTYADLLDPKWRGRIAWNGFPVPSGGAGFVGTVLAEMGEDKGMAYLREFAKQNVTNVAGSAREVLDQVVAGEYAIGLQIFNHHAVISKKKGAPVDWIKMEPMTGTLSVGAIHKDAPHPNAAKLLMDFITSREGQTVFRNADYLTANPEMPSLDPALKPEEGHFRVQFFTPEQVDELMPKWKEAFDELFR